jgi:superfamily II DNA or RNA helicase
MPPVEEALSSPAAPAVPELRPYQLAAVAAVERHWAISGPRATVELATGCGKTVIAGALCRPRLERGERVLVLVHRRELVHQLSAHLSALTGEQAGLVLGSEGERSYGARIVVASIETLRRQKNLDRYLLHGMPALAVVDECHHAGAGVGGYEKVLDALPGAAVLGLSATPWRTDGRGLVTGPIVFSRGIVEMTEAGYLAPLRWQRRVIGELHLGRVRTAQSQGERDFRPEDLSEEMRQEGVVAATARLVAEVPRERPVLVFCVDVAHARALGTALRSLGAPTATVLGETGKHERQEVLAKWRTGELHVVTSVGVLTEGFDFPELSCLVMARPTMSAGLYVQMLGRGTRLAPGKADCLVVDVAGNPHYGAGKAVHLGYLLGEDAEDGLDAVDVTVGTGDQAPRSLYLLDPMGRGPWAWCRGGPRWYVAQVGKTWWAFLLADQTGSGLWWPVLSGSGYEGEQRRDYFLDNGYPLPLRDAVGACLATAQRNGLAARFLRQDADWRKKPGVSGPQARALGAEVLQSVPTERWTRGLASDLLTARWATPEADKLLCLLDRHVAREAGV